jgi:hypothetical protein
MKAPKFGLEIGKNGKIMKATTPFCSGEVGTFEWQMRGVRVCLKKPDRRISREAAFLAIRKCRFLVSLPLFGSRTNPLCLFST